MRQQRKPRHALALGFAITLVATLGTRPLAAQVLKHGDVNGDMVVSALDAQAILSGQVGLSLPGGFVLANGDANCDEITQALDAQIVLMHVIGLNTSTHCVGQNYGPGATQVALTPTDSSVLIGNERWIVAALKDSAGFDLQRPISWQTSNAAIAVIDSTIGDSVLVKGVGEGTVTITAFADGSAGSTTLKVVRDYTGIYIRPERGDTIFQLNGTMNFDVRMRDSVGAQTGVIPSAFWFTTDTSIAVVLSGGTAGTDKTVIAKTTGITMLGAVDASNPADTTLVPLHVILPPINSCTGEGGTLHSSETYSTPQTWSASTNPHYVYGQVRFDSLANLTIEPGTLVCMASSAWLYFHHGAQLSAVGTAQEPINIQSLTPESPWYQIQLGDDVSHPATAPMDTSVFRNVIIEGGDNFYGSVSGWERHVVLMDSVHFRRSGYTAVLLSSSWSSMTRSVIDTVGVFSSGYAAYLGRGHLDSTTIRVGMPEVSAAVAFKDDSASLRAVTIEGGERGLYITSSGVDSVRINDVTIGGTTDVAMELAASVLHSSSGNVTVLSTAGSAWRGSLENLARLFPDSASQETLRTPALDTLEITGSRVFGDTAVARIDLPWRVNGNVLIDAGAVLSAHPGAVFSFQSGSMQFQNGGTLQALGTVTAPVTFLRRSAGSFSGLLFENPPGSTRDTSRLRNVVIARASGICGGVTCSAISSYDRHVLLIDSTVVQQSGNGGVSLAGVGSVLRWSTIDSTQTESASYPGLYLGAGTFADSVTVLRSGTVAVEVAGGLADTARLRAVHIDGSEGIGLHAEGARIVGDSGSVFIANAAYPYRGYFDSFAALASTAEAQANFLGNSDDVAVIVGRSDRPAKGRAGVLDTITAVPSLRWQVEGDAYVDTLMRFFPQPGARISFWNGGLHFRSGGRLIARGTPTDTISFYPVDHNAGGTFRGLEFHNPGAAGGTLPPAPPMDTSYLVNVRLGEATQVCADLGCATVATESRHVLLIDSVRVRVAHGGAIHLAARGSRISRSRIDTTLSTSYAALALGPATAAEDVTVYGSGQAGVYLEGNLSSLADTVRLRNVVIDSSQSVGLWAENARLVGDSGSVTAIRNAYPFRGYVDNFAAIAKRPSEQTNLLGNVQDVAVIVGRSDRPFHGSVSTGKIDTLAVIPELPWEVENHVYMDTLARFAPQPGSRIGFWSAGMTFQRGARLIARGTNTDSIVFEKYSPTSGTFNGIRFANSGAGIDTSYVVNTIVRTVENSQCGSLACAALSADNRHVLIVDSSRVDSTSNAGVALAAPGSRISRSVIHRAGSTSSYAGLHLGGGTRAESTTVQFARGVGVEVDGALNTLSDTVRLSAITILNSGGVGLYAEGGRIVGDSGSITASGNAYPYRGYLDNFAAIAKDAASQTKLLGNVQDLAVILGRSERPFRGRLTSGLRDTITVIPQLPWQVVGQTYFDSLATFMPQPGARIGFWGGGLTFERGGRLLSRGTASDTIVFARYSATSGNFNGLRFENHGGSGLDTSWVVNTLVTDAQSCQSIGWGCAVLGTDDRHVLVVDSSRVSSVSHGAVHLAASGSRISRSVIDSAGNNSSSYIPLILAPGTLAESTTVNHSRTTAVWAAGAVGDTTDARSVRLRELSILNGAGAGLWAEHARIIADSVTVTGNAYPFRGFIDNFVALGPDSVAQDRLLGNGDDRAEIVGSSSRPLRGGPENIEVPLTAIAIPQLRWQVESEVRFDTLTRFEPHAGATLTFWDGSLYLRQGAHMLAFGSETDSIDFRPVAGRTFRGIRLESPGADGGAFPAPPPTASSMLQFVNIDSTSGVNSLEGFTGSGINAGARHVLAISDSRFRRNIGPAIALQAPNSSLARVRIDTTGNLTSSQPAVLLEDSVSLQDVEVYRSGNNGIYIQGKGVTFQNVTVRKSLGYGIEISGDNAQGSQHLQLSDFIVDSNALGGVFVAADSVQLSQCVVSASGSTSGQYGVQTSPFSAIEGLVIFSCDFENNPGLAVANARTDSAYFIQAAGNWWGSPTPTIGGPNGVGVNVGAGSPCSSSCSGGFQFVPVQTTSLPPAIPSERPEIRPFDAERRRRRRRYA